MEKKLLLGIALGLSVISLANAPSKSQNYRMKNLETRIEYTYQYSKSEKIEELTNFYKQQIEYERQQMEDEKNLADFLDLETPAFRNSAEKIKEELTLKLTIKRSKKFVEEVYRSAKGIKYEKERILALIYAESEGNKNAKSRIGARGLTQITKSTWEWMEPNKDFHKHVYEPVLNIKVGIKTLNWFENYCKENCPYWDNIDEEGRIKLVSACYNAGQRTIEEKNWDISKTLNETRIYSSRLLWAYNKLKKEGID